MSAIFKSNFFISSMGVVDRPTSGTFRTSTTMGDAVGAGFATVDTFLMAACSTTSGAAYWPGMSDDRSVT